MNIHMYTKATGSLTSCPAQHFKRHLPNVNTQQPRTGQRTTSVTPHRSRRGDLTTTPTLEALPVHRHSHPSRGWRDLTHYSTARVRTTVARSRAPTDLPPRPEADPVSPAPRHLVRPTHHHTQDP